MSLERIRNDLGAVVSADRAHVWHHLSQHKQYETTDPRVFVEGKGLRLWDAAGREYLDEKRVQAVVADCAANGVLIGATNRSLPGLNNTLCLSPGLIATADDIDTITNAIDSALTRLEG